MPTLRELLQEGDALVKRGEVEAGVRRYLEYCAQLMTSDAPRQKRLLHTIALHRQVLKLLPQRSDVRCTLIKAYVAAGLRADARTELETLERDAKLAGDVDRIRFVAEWLERLGTLH